MNNASSFETYNPKTENLLAFAGSLLGLMAGLVMGLLRLGLVELQSGIETPGPPFNGELIGGLAFMLLFMLPFALSLAATRWPEAVWRAAVWGATAVLGMLAAFTTFSFVALVLFPVPALLLGIAAALAGRHVARGQIGLLLVIAASLILVGRAAWSLLFIQENPQCWALILTTEGDAVWQTRPFSQSGQLPAEPGPGDPIRWTCSSDIIAPTEALLALGLWALLLLGLRWLKTHLQNDTKRP